MNDWKKVRVAISERSKGDSPRHIHGLKGRYELLGETPSDGSPVSQFGHREVRGRSVKPADNGVKSISKRFQRLACVILCKRNLRASLHLGWNAIDLVVQR